MRIETKEKLKLKPKYEQLVDGRVDYSESPELLDAAQNTTNERELYEISKRVVAEIFGNQHEQQLTLIDLCAGSGLFAQEVLQVVNFSKAIIIDTDHDFLNYAGQKLKKYAKITEFRNEDAAFFSNRQKADLVLMGSAYHHILDEDKLAFLSNTSLSLAEDGYILVNENFIPPYEDTLESYRSSVFTFYSQLISYLESEKNEKEAVNVLRQTAWYGFHRDYEYKVSMEVFLNHVELAGLAVERRIQVWSVDNDDSVGSFVVLLKKASSK